MFREKVVLFPINPKQLARYRESYSSAGCKADRSAAALLARMLCERHTQLAPWRPDDETTRVLARLCRNRRQLIDEKTRLTQQALEQLKAYFPQVLRLKTGKSFSPLLLAVLRRWPDPRKLKRADRRLLHKVFRQHGRRNEQQRAMRRKNPRIIPFLSPPQPRLDKKPQMSLSAACARGVYAYPWRFGGPSAECRVRIAECNDDRRLAGLPRQNQQPGGRHPR